MDEAQRAPVAEPSGPEKRVGTVVNGTVKSVDAKGAPDFVVVIGVADQDHALQRGASLDERI